MELGHINEPGLAAKIATAISDHYDGALLTGLVIGYTYIDGDGGEMEGIEVLDDQHDIRTLGFISWMDVWAREGVRREQRADD